MRFSRPLEQFASACRPHMTDTERSAVDADPLWTDEGQVLWILEQVAWADALTPASAIAAELGCQPPVVGSALQKLSERGAVAAHTVVGRTVWGTATQVHRMDATRQRVEEDRADDAKRIVDRNRALDEVRRQLEMRVAGRGIEVTSLSRMSPAAWNDTRLDQLMMVTDDPDSAVWLLGRLSDSG
ncbi:hypothetical protein ACIBM3_33345 [Rhodococcus erythropolis]|uniref:hypothetical protein n=1 Tax=Rhodococcus erythropolis TaxID=1833 RepID=UPI00379A95D6